jgi:hypothetical protein
MATAMKSRPKQKHAAKPNGVEQTAEPQAAAPPLEAHAPETNGAAPKIVPVHPWAGMQVCYWRITNALTGEISPLPAMLIQPTFRANREGTESWDVNVFRTGQLRGQRDVKRSDTPRAGCWTWGPQGAPK